MWLAIHSASYPRNEVVVFGLIFLASIRFEGYLLLALKGVEVSMSVDGTLKRAAIGTVHWGIEGRLTLYSMEQVHVIFFT